MKEKQNITYILQCGDGTLYTGWTNDLNRRLMEHNGGQGAKYTRGRRPVKLVYAEAYDTKREAMQREFQIKKLTRKEKEALINGQAQEQITPQESPGGFPGTDLGNFKK